MSLEGKYAELSEGQNFTSNSAGVKEVGDTSLFTSFTSSISC